MGIRISGVGTYLPDKKLRNEDLAERVDTSHQWIVEHTGICERRICGDDQAPSDLGYRAALDCLRQAGVEAESVDLIIVACATPDQSQPAVACMIQEKLGIARQQCPAFDVNSVCAGFVFALDVAQSMMLANPGQFARVLVIGTEAFSRIVDFDDRRTCIFFGDGAGAVLLSRTEGDHRMHFRLGSDGRGRRLIEVPGGGTALPTDRAVLEKRLNKFRMDGPKVWDFAVRAVPAVIRSLLSEHGLEPRDLDLLILHQSNLRMIEAIMASLELPMDRTVTTLETLGNTAAASIPITLHEAAKRGRLEAGSRLVLCGFGGGLSWGAALLQWG